MRKIKQIYIDNPKLMEETIGKMIKKYMKQEKKAQDIENNMFYNGKWSGIDECWSELTEEVKKS